MRRTSGPARSVGGAWALAAGLGYALLYGLALPPAGLSWLTPLAPVGLMLLALRSGGAPGRAGVAAALGTLPLWLIEERWVAQVSAAGYPLLCLYLSVYVWLFVWIGGRALQLGLPRWAKPVALAALWLGIETLRGRVVFGGYNWFFLAQPLVDLPAAGLARLAGATGASLLTALVGALLAMAAHDRRARRLSLLAAIALALLANAGGWLLLRTPAAAPQRVIRVGLVQTNVPQSNKQTWTAAQRKADFARFVALTEALADADPPPDVIVWPETMYPGLTLDPAANEIERQAGLRFADESGEAVATTDFYDQLLALSRRVRIPLLVGAIGVEGRRLEPVDGGGVVPTQRAKFNSLYLVHDGAVVARQDKRRLTPFGEFLPYFRRIPPLERLLLTVGAAGMAFDLDEGAPSPPFAIELHNGDSARIAAVICFESTYPDLVRRLALQGANRRADLLVNATNDGWFGPSRAGRLQHLQIARWRAVETATPLARAANTGLSACIDAHGGLVPLRRVGKGQLHKTVQFGPANVAGAFVAAVPLPASSPLRAAAWADGVIAWGCLALTALAALAPAGKTSRRTRTA